METSDAHPIALYRARHGLSQEQFGNLVNVQKPAVSKWEDNVRPSPQKALEIEKATNGEVPTWKLRPDLWPAPEQQVAS